MFQRMLPYVRSIAVLSIFFALPVPARAVDTPDQTIQKAAASYFVGDNVTPTVYAVADNRYAIVLTGNPPVTDPARTSHYVSQVHAQLMKQFPDKIDDNPIQTSFITPTPSQYAAAIQSLAQQYFTSFTVVPDADLTHYQIILTGGSLQGGQLTTQADLQKVAAALNAQLGGVISHVRPVPIQNVTTIQNAIQTLLTSPNVIPTVRVSNDAKTFTVILNGNPPFGDPARSRGFIQSVKKVLLDQFKLHGTDIRVLRHFADPDYSTALAQYFKTSFGGPQSLTFAVTRARSASGRDYYRVVPVGSLPLAALESEKALLDDAAANATTQLDIDPVVAVAVDYSQLGASDLPMVSDRWPITSLGNTGTADPSITGGEVPNLVKAMGSVYSSSPAAPASPGSSPGQAQTPASTSPVTTVTTTTAPSPATPASPAGPAAAPGAPAPAAGNPPAGAANPPTPPTLTTVTTTTTGAPPTAPSTTAPGTPGSATPPAATSGAAPGTGTPANGVTPPAGAPTSPTTAGQNAGSGTPVITNDNTSIMISSDFKTALKVEGLLALLDSPSPKVQLQVWAVQLSGNQADVASAMDYVNADIEATQDRVTQVNDLFHEAAAAYYANAFANKTSREADGDWVFANVYRHMFGIHDAVVLSRLFPRESAATFQENPFDRAMPAVVCTMLINSREDLEIVLAKVLFAIHQDRWSRYDRILTMVEALEDKSIDLTSAYGSAKSAKAMMAAAIDDAIAQKKLDDTKLSCINVLVANTEKAYAAFDPFVDAALRSNVRERDPDRQQYMRLCSEWRVLQQEGNENLFSRYQDFETSTGSVKLRAIQDFMVKVRTYDEMVRALGIYDVPQGAVQPDTDKNGSLVPKINSVGDLDTDIPTVTFVKDAQAPADLKASAAVLDEYIERAVTSYQLDLQEAYLNPLLKRIRDDDRDKLPRDGIALSAKTTIAVNDRRQAIMSPTMTSYINNTVPAPFGASLLGTAVSAPNTSAATAPNLLAGLPLPQAIAIQALLNDQVQPSFAQIAPGISINVTPSVSPDGSSADLNLTVNFGVPTTAPTASPPSNEWPVQTPSAVNSDQTTTLVTVNGSELFPVSSFDIQTSVPRPPAYVPILGRLPVIGPAFQFPQGPARTDYESILLVNAVVISRSMGLVGFYGANKSGRLQALPADTKTIATQKDRISGADESWDWAFQN